MKGIRKSGRKHGIYGRDHDRKRIDINHFCATKLLYFFTQYRAADAKEIKLYSKFLSYLSFLSEGHNYNSMLWEMVVFCSNPCFNQSLMRLARKCSGKNKGHEQTCFNEVFIFQLQIHKRQIAKKPKSYKNICMKKISLLNRTNLTKSNATISDSKWVVKYWLILFHRCKHNQQIRIWMVTIAAY